MSPRAIIDLAPLPARYPRSGAQRQARADALLAAWARRAEEARGMAPARAQAIDAVVEELGAERAGILILRTVRSIDLLEHIRVVSEQGGVLLRIIEVEGRAAQGRFGCVFDLGELERRLGAALGSEPAPPRKLGPGLNWQDAGALHNGFLPRWGAPAHNFICHREAHPEEFIERLKSAPGLRARFEAGRLGLLLPEPGVSVGSRAGL